MKRCWLCLLAAVLAASVAACGSGKTDNMSSAASDSASESSSAPDGESVPSPVPSESSEPEAGGDAVSLEIQDPKLKAAFDAVRSEFGEAYLTMPAVVTEQQMQEIYYVNPDDIEEFAGEMSLVNTSGDTLVGVKAKPGRAQAVADALEKRRADIISQFEQYPVNFMDIKSQAAQVVTVDDYVFLVLMGEINVPDGEDATLQMAEDEVSRAVSALKSAIEGASK